MSADDTIEPIETLGKSLYADKELHDLVLQGSDNVEVTACRNVLAARTPFFKRMLYGSFNEASKQTVKVEQEGRILESIVEYLHTGSVAMLEDEDQNSDIEEKEETNNRNRKAATTSCEQELLKLNSAALFFHLTSLAAKIEKKLIKLIKSHPESSFGVLEVADAPSTPAEALSQAWENVHLNKGSILKNKLALEPLSASVVELILRDDHHSVTEIELFRMLQLWASGGGGDQQREDERQETAKSLCQKYIKLELMDAGEVSADAAPSGFFTDAQLFEAYKSFALAAKEAQDQDIVLPPKKKRRLGPSILVEGAGSDIINGSYNFVGLRDEGYTDDLLLFVKNEDVEWKGQVCEARIYTAASVSKWRICLVPTGRKMVESEILSFYSTKKANDDDQLPPTDGWYQRAEGHKPVPKLTFLE